ncbi:MAG TPA: hypothetical protein VK149_03615 [Sideroxyarcus sp.]|nr:hypothetical protein [Sideroxyarcus sp.]
MVLKRDVRGRVRTPSEQREALVEEFERSGLPGTQFAKLVGMKYSTLMSWVERERRSRSGRARQHDRPVFAEAVMASPDAQRVADSAVVLRLLGGATVEIKDRGQVSLVADLLKALA